jgi:hypothetical protein
MRYCQHFRYFAVFLVLALVSEPCAHTQDKGDFIRTVQGAYYSLPKEGITELQCSVGPDWAAILSQEMKTEVKPDNAGLKLLNGVRFWVSVSETGNAKLTHQVDHYPQSPGDMDNLQKAIGGVEETTDGFWRAVSIFLFTSALPKPETAYQLSEQDSGYALSYRDGGYDIATTVAKDYAISEIKATSATLSSSLKPKFTKTTAGFLLTAYDADYKQGAADPAHVSVQITYQDVESFHLPSDLVVQTTSEGAKHYMRLHFANYQIKRR